MSRSDPNGPEDYFGLVDAVRSCSLKPESSDKARCVDRLAGSLAMARPDGGERTQARMGGWVPSRDNSSYAIGLASQAFQSDDDTLKDGVAELFVRCREGHLEAFVSFGRRVTDKGVLKVPLSVRFDEGNYEDQVWTPSVSGMAIGVWSADAVRSFLSRMSGSHKFVVRLRLPDRGALFVAFQVAGAEKALREISDRCR